jgi:hypothetical protein
MDLYVMPTAPSAVSDKNEGGLVEDGKVILLKVASHMFCELDTPNGIYSTRRPPGSSRKVMLYHLILWIGQQCL